MDRNNRIRFAGNNFNDETVTSTTVTESSELSTNPYTNSQKQERHFQWITQGHFEITSSNNVLKFKESGSGTLVATIVTGHYTSPDALATAIQTALNNASTPKDWQCSYATPTGTFTITKTDTPAAAELLLTETSSAIWDTIGYTGVSDLVGAPFSSDQRRNHTSEYVIWDLGSPTEITMLAVIGRRNEVFSVGENATVTLKGNSINDFTTPAVTRTITPGADGIFDFLDDLSNTTYRYWKLEFEDKLNSIGPTGFKFSHIYLGDYITLTQRNVERGLINTQFDPSLKIETDSGVEYHKLQQKYFVFSNLNLPFVASSDRKTLQQFIYDNGSHTPFYISLDPTLAVSTDLSELTRYVRFDSNPILTHIKTDVYSIGFSVKEVI